MLLLLIVKIIYSPIASDLDCGINPKFMVLLIGGMGRNRRALSTINGNIVEAPQYPCKVHKKNGITE